MRAPVEPSGPSARPRCFRSSMRSSSIHGRKRSTSRTSSPVFGMRRQTVACPLLSAYTDTMPGVGSQPHSHSSLLPATLTRLRVWLEHACLAILPDVIPREALPVHRDVDTDGQCLHERKRAAEVEETVGAAEGVRDHC